MCSGFIIGVNKCFLDRLIGMENVVVVLWIKSETYFQPPVLKCPTVALLLSLISFVFGDITCGIIGWIDP